MLRSTPGPLATPRGAARSIALAGLAGLLSLALASTAAATPADVFFDGMSIPADPNTNFGISQATAFDLRDNLGFDIITDASTGGIGGFFDINQSFQGVSTNPATDPVNRSESDWSVENVSGGDIVGNIFLMFTHSDPFQISGVPIDYDDLEIGLTIDPDDGWVIIEAVTGLGTFYYPAILLGVGGDTFSDGETSDVFDVLQVVLSTLIEAPAGSGVFYLPELQLGAAVQAVPEPGSVSLVALGLLGLARRRGNRS